MPTSAELPPEPHSVAVARRWAAEQLAAAGLDDLVDPVVLLVSELVSNAVLHAATACTVELGATTGRDGSAVLHVEVRDASPALPKLVDRSDPMADSGRGLHLVRSLSAACGADLVVGGKRVWFEVPVPVEAPVVLPVAADAPVAAPPHPATA